MKSINKTSMVVVLALLGASNGAEFRVPDENSLDNSEQIQTFAESGIRFVIPCKTQLCQSYLSKLNPSNDWLPYKNDEVDKGDEEDEGESAPKGHKAFPHGSKHYGHVQTRNSMYHNQLDDDHLRKEIKQNEAQEKKEHHVLH